MEFGLVLNGYAHEGASASFDFPSHDGVVAQVRLAEKLGFTCAWPFKLDCATVDVPAPWPEELISKIAAATRTIRIGYRLWPTSESVRRPFYAAEQAAALDVLCEGRLEIDCSSTDRRLAAARASPALGSSESIWEEAEGALRSIIQTWSKSALWSNRDFDDLNSEAIAKPIRRSHPLLWMPVNDSSEWDLAAQLGVGVVVNAPPDTALQSRIDTYRHAVGRSRALGRIGSQVAVSALAICVADAGSEVSVDRQAARWPVRRERPSGGTTAATISRPAPTRLQTGDVERCIQDARAYARVGVKRLWCHFPARSGTGAAQTDAMTRFAHDVMSAFA
jgi:alkanesulfonate monooxygenase SsuD/methylene tetrahydromethanopterin reductase-like flavin-dependent oxidoreductase (luciferase family)